MPLNLVKGDLARIVDDAAIDGVIVPTNPMLRIDGGSCLAVSTRAGLEESQQALDAIRGERLSMHLGSCVALPGFGLDVKCVVHAVLTSWDLQEASGLPVLVDLYRRALSTACAQGAQSIALSLMGAGLSGYPVREAFVVATTAIRSFLATHDDVDVTLVLFDEEALQVASDLYHDVKHYLDEPWDGGYEIGAAPREASAPMVCAMPRSAAAPAFVAPFFEGTKECSFDETVCVPASLEVEKASESLDDYLLMADVPFGELLCHLIDERDLRDSDVYKRANVSRQTFNKIRNNQVQPSKRTVFALAIALELDVFDAEELLERAGYCFSPADKLDRAVRWFIEHGVYDVFDVNAALFKLDLPLLGSSVH